MKAIKTFKTVFCWKKIDWSTHWPVFLSWEIKEIKRIIRECFAQFNTKKWKHLNKKSIFIEKYSLPKLTPGKKIEKSIQEIEKIVKELPL